MKKTAFSCLYSRHALGIIYTFAILLLLSIPLLGTAQIKVDNNGNLGVGIYTPQKTLHVFSTRGEWDQNIRSEVVNDNTVGICITNANGKSQNPGDNFWVTGCGAIFCFGSYHASDSTLKMNISTIDSPINRLLALRGVTYKWKPIMVPHFLPSDSDYSGTDSTEADSTFAIDSTRIDSSLATDSLPHYGFIAQEVQEAFPSHGMTQHMPNGLNAIAYNEVIPLLVEGFKAQQLQINTISEGGSCGNKSFYTAGGCAAFAKTDMLNASSRYLEACSDPSSDSRRLWLGSSDNISLKYWDNQSTPVKQTIEIQSNKNAANGYAGLNSSSKITGAQQTYGAAANTACEGNDGRLSDARSGKLNYVDNSTHTGSATTAEEILATIQIPGGTLGPNDIIEVTVSGQHVSNANNKTYRLRWNNASTLGGTIFATKTVTTTTGFSGYCRIVMKNSSSAQEVNGPNSGWDATGASTAVTVSGSLSLGSDIYILLTSQHANAADNQQILNYQIRILKP